MRRDLLVLMAVLAASIGSAHAVSLWENFLGWSEAGVRWDIEEVALVSSIALIGFAVFAWRRWQELMTTLTDLDATSKRNEALLEVEHRFAVAFDHASIGMALLSGPGKFLSTNRTLWSMLDLPPEHLDSAHLIEIIDPADQAEAARALSWITAGREEAARFESRLLRGDGSRRWARLNVAAVRNDTGTTTSLVAHIEDITARVEAEERLRELLESKDQLIASVSHELRTPLSAVVGFAEVLRDDSSLSPQERTEMTQSIAEQGNDLTHIIEDLLVAARLEAESLSIATVPVDLRAQVAQVLESLEHLVGEKKVQVVGTARKGAGDPARIRQVLRNLISNAIRYGGEHIEVRLRDTTAGVAVAVWDDGEGVPEGQIQTIFDPYQTAHRSKGITASVGLGLTISKELASLMNGDLTYSSRDGGAVFELSLPGNAAAAEAHASTPPRGRVTVAQSAGAPARPERTSPTY